MWLLVLLCHDLGAEGVADSNYCVSDLGSIGFWLLDYCVSDLGSRGRGC